MSRLLCVAASLLAIGGTGVVVLAGQDGESAGGKSADRARLVVKRRAELTDEELRKQLQSVPETGLDQESAAMLYSPIEEGLRRGDEVKALRPDLGPAFFQGLTVRLQRPDQFALPWRAGRDCEMGKEAAERLHVLSTKLRDALRRSVPTGDVRPEPDKLRALLTGREWGTPDAIPTLTQMMQAENSPIRLLLVEMLENIQGKEASTALAQRAVFDLSPVVREKAVKALANRSPAEFTPILFYALRYPWPAAADHAAEALAALKITDSVPELAKLLNVPNPALPFKGAKGLLVTELVRVNHLSNCMLCHAPSLARGDLVRGRVPMPGEDPPPLYYAETRGLFIRADITYLRQDFSVVQPVALAGKWPGNQRYDYLLRTRPLTRQELRTWQKLDKDKTLPQTYPQREATLFALRQITGKDLGDSYEGWAADLPKILRELKAAREKR